MCLKKGPNAEKHWEGIWTTLILLWNSTLNDIEKVIEYPLGLSIEGHEKVHGQPKTRYFYVHIERDSTLLC